MNIKKMAKDDLETKCKKAVLKIADTMQDISMKLCHIIEYHKKNFYDSQFYNNNYK